jgi:hypothetical protein
MKKPIIKLIDVSTGSEIDREMTDEEFDQYKIDQANAIADKAKAETEAKAKATAKAAILDRIGLTADELKTILG